jgi:hypothetical protein
MTKLLYHVTTQSGWEGIQRDGAIKPNKDGQIWFCDGSALNATIQWMFFNKKFVSIMLATEVESHLALPWFHVRGVYIMEEPVTLYYFVAALQIPPTIRGKIKAFDRWDC